MDEDFLLAIRLQEQFDNEYEAPSYPPDSFSDHGFGHSSKKRKVERAGGGSDAVPYWKPSAEPDRPLSIVDASWETLDPSPDVRAMFLEFNEVFFSGKLLGVEVKWSPRMTLCAGVCSYEGRGGLCSIRLSEPLLKLRPRKDLVETLLHEMIHALLFVTQNNRDRDGHGPEFCKHMNRINDASGTKISVYHSFHDEVDVYRQHWWKCDGPCQNRKPYMGFVKRAMNRAPSAQDPWWADHQRTCGGNYTKVKEPEGYGQKGKKDGKKNGKTTEKKSSEKEKPPSATAGSGSQDIRNTIPFSGKGFLLGGMSQPPSSSSPVPSSPKRLFTPPSPAKSLGSPVRSGLGGKGLSGSSAGLKRPVKKSVANIRAFVNINGSPVRIPKPHSGGRSQGADPLKQKSIGELFSSHSIGRPAAQSSSSSSNTHAKKESLPSLNSNASSIFPKQRDNSSASAPAASEPSQSSRPVVSTKPVGGPAKPTQSKYFSHSNSDGASGPASRKRPWDDHRSPASIADFFQKTSGSDSESTKNKSPAMQQRAAAASSSSSSSSPRSSAGLLSFTRPSLSSPSSSAPTVSCPVCQAEVQESKINAHLDSCLS
ncbi:SprT-like domain-containing protein Spartan [Liparis tanakae]|uniref:DNA-dependent metalloprotease SPRTN n=1 Tax=Liparis tanakae TaxID=230148 RepID=A0A4Z2G6D1_9TELE|nr:SprT-like domain-containing protein Spartan [Liparis tanakae]